MKKSEPIYDMNKSKPAKKRGALKQRIKQPAERYVRRSPDKKTIAQSRQWLRRG
jgi:hypothetical protein